MLHHLLRYCRTISIAAASSGALPVPSFNRPTRFVAASLALAAGATHLALTPEHFQERTVYGVFFLAASGFQIALGLLLLTRPGPRVYRAGAWGSLGLLATWIVTRAVAPPFSPEGLPEPVTLLGVLATALELAVLLLLASALPLPTGRPNAARWAWSLGSGLSFAALFLLSSGAVSYTSLDTGAPSIDFAFFQGASPLTSPLFFGMLLPHLWLVGSLFTLLLILAAAALLGANVSASLGRASAVTGNMLPRRRTLLAVAPSMFAVSSCCGASTALFLGVAAVGPLYAATPWILLATVAMLSINLRILRRKTPACVVTPRSTRASPDRW